MLASDNPQQWVVAPDWLQSSLVNLRSNFAIIVRPRTAAIVLLC